MLLATKTQAWTWNFKFCLRARLRCAVSVFQSESQSGSRAGTVGKAFNFGKFKLFSLSVTLWSYPYSLTETCSTIRLKLGPGGSGCRSSRRRRPARAPRLVVPPAGPALPGLAEAVRLSSAQVVLQASRMQQWRQLYRDTGLTVIRVCTKPCLDVMEMYWICILHVSSGLMMYWNCN